MRLMKPIDQIFHPGSRLQAVEDDHIPFLQRGETILFKTLVTWFKLIVACKNLWLKYDPLF